MSKRTQIWNKSIPKIYGVTDQTPKEVVAELGDAVALHFKNPNELMFFMSELLETALKVWPEFFTDYEEDLKDYPGLDE